MINKDKLFYFEFIIAKLLEWNKEFSNDLNNNDFSTLKSLKLLFFVSAANSSSNSQNNNLLDNVFNKFCAMPYGHVESDIYDLIKRKQGDLDYIKINSQTCEVKSNIHDLVSYKDEITTEIINAIDYIKAMNSGFVLLPAFELVNLSHSWYSWQFYYTKAKKSGLHSQLIDVNIIKSEDKIFSLEIF